MKGEPGKQVGFKLPAAPQQETQIVTTIDEAQTEGKIESTFYAANNRSATWAGLGPVLVEETAR